MGMSYIFNEKKRANLLRFSPPANEPLVHLAVYNVSVSTGTVLFVFLNQGLHFI